VGLGAVGQERGARIGEPELAEADELVGGEMDGAAGSGRGGPVVLVGRVGRIIFAAGKVAHGVAGSDGRKQSTALRGGNGEG